MLLLNNVYLTTITTSLQTLKFGNVLFVEIQYCRILCEHYCCNYFRPLKRMKECVQQKTKQNMPTKVKELEMINKTKFANKSKRIGNKNQPASSLNEILQNALQANFLPFKICLQFFSLFSCTDRKSVV